MEISVNIWAVIVSAIASMVIGSIWYGPLFGKQFMHEMGMDSWSKEKQDEMRKSMATSYVMQFIASLVMFYVFAKIAHGLHPLTITNGIKTSLLVWLGFILPVKFADTLWGGNKNLFWLSVTNMLLTLTVTGIIIGAWH